MRGERIAAPIVALLIVLSGAGGAIAPGASPIGTAEAQLGDGSGGACDVADWTLTLITGTLLTTDCKTAQDVSEEWNETDAKQTRTQIHSQGGQLAAANEQYLTGLGNALTDSNTIAFSKGEAAAVEVLSNGGTVAEAQDAANQTIANYYAKKHINLIDRYDVSIQTVKTLKNRSATTTGVSDDFVTLTNRYEKTPSDTATILNSDPPKTSVTIANQSTVQSDQIEFTDGDQTKTFSINNIEKYEQGEGYYNIGTLSLATRYAVRSTDNLSSKVILHAWDFKKHYREINTRKNETQQEVAVYIEQSLGPAVENGNLDAESYVSPATLAQEYAQEYGNDTSYIRATAIAAYSGMDAPDLEQTGSMTITYNGTTYEGLLLSQEAPNGGWQSGETYDPALLSGIQMFAVAGDNSSIVELDGPFTVESITGTDGEEISKATTFNVTYETTNESANYTELQQQIRSLNEQIEERQAQATTGGSDVETNDGLLAKIAAALGVGTGVVLVGAAAVVVVVARFYLPDQ